MHLRISITYEGYYESGVEIVDCVIEAVISNKARHIDWRDLKDASVWQLGWK